MINVKMAVCIGAAMILKTFSFAQADSNKAQNTYVPARIAVLPGLSSQGKKDPYTTSNFSINVLGGRTGSVNGLELGNLFNIDNGYMNGVQGAGYFNITAGDVTGLQMGGLFNVGKSNVTGLQMGGILNIVQKDVRGLQMSGIHNQVAGRLTGVQMGGISNHTTQAVKGMQMAGIANISSSTVTGFQIAGILNYAKHLKGLQLGLINIADTSSGYSIGLITIVKKGYHKITVSTNEVLHANVAVKSGNAKLYNILLVGVNTGSDEKIFSYGYGIGHEFRFGKLLTLNPELTSQYLYLGNWHYNNSLNRLQVLATVKLAPKLALFAGPAFSVYYSDQPEAVKGYKYLVPGDNYHAYDLWNNNVTGWFGWTAGLSFL